MATRSLIGKLNTDKSVTYIYCHFNGYDVGSILDESYSKLKEINALLRLGGLSSLDSSLKDCVAYHRDRGEPLRIGRSPSKEHYLIKATEKHCADYSYLFEKGTWYCWCQAYFVGRFSL